MKLIALSISAGLAVLALSACGANPPPVPSYTPPAPVAQSHIPAARPAAPVNTPPVAYKPMAEDSCGAAPLQALVGKLRTEIPVPLDPSTRRVVCSSCVITQEFRADRQTITFDSATGLITSVKCG